MRISDWSSDVCSSDLGEIAIVADRRAAALIEQSSLQRIEYGGMGLGRSAIMMPLVRLAGPLLVRSPATARYLPYVTALSWVIVALLAAGGLAAAGALVGLGRGSERERVGQSGLASVVPGQIKK